MSTTQVAVAQPKKATFSKKLAVTTAGTLSALTATVSQAALNVTPLETEIASNGASMETIMLAILTLVALYVGYRMVRRAMG